MTIADHVRTAVEFLERSEREFSNGDELQGSEKLWGAASHSVMAVATRRGWRYSKHNAKVAAVNRLSQEFDEPALLSDLLVAEQFHANFYHDFMEDDVIERGRPIVERFVRRMLELVEEEQADSSD